MVKYELYGPGDFLTTIILNEEFVEYYSIGTTTEENDPFYPGPKAGREPSGNLPHLK
jgi:hypothetical protein